jgi:hypothetical protein
MFGEKWTKKYVLLYPSVIYLIMLTCPSVLTLHIFQWYFYFLYEPEVSISRSILLVANMGLDVTHIKEKRQPLTLKATSFSFPGNKMQSSCAVGDKETPFH